MNDPQLVQLCVIGVFSIIRSPRSLRVGLVPILYARLASVRLRILETVSGYSLPTKTTSLIVVHIS